MRSPPPAHVRWCHAADRRVQAVHVRLGTQAGRRFEQSHGAEANTLRGVPIIVLTTVGAKSGALRKTALMRVEHDGRYPVVASKGGAPDEPSGTGTCAASPTSSCRTAPSSATTRARELSGDERVEWWARAPAVWPDYDNYQTKTDRLIAIFVLEPHDG